MQVYAYAAKSRNSSLEPFTYSKPHLGPHEVFIQVSHCGLCHSDIHLIQDDWNRSIYPLVPGHEVVGVIVEEGSSVTPSRLGQTVGVSWIHSSCMHCPSCLQGETNICLEKATTCNGHYGGFADFMVADSRFAYPIPKGIDPAHAAPLLCAGATVYTPLRRYGIQSIHSVAVLGIGGLGHLALKFAKAFGAEVTALSHSPEKKSEAFSFGAHHFYTLDRLPDPLQFDLILSTISHEAPWNRLLTLLKPYGTLCFLGRPQKPLDIDASLLVSLHRNLSGSATANRFGMQEMLQFALHHQITPQIECLPLWQVNEGIEKTRTNRARYRIVFDCLQIQKP